MKRRQSILLLLTTILFAFTALAQNSKQELNDQMWEAVRQGDAAAVKSLLDKGADVNARFRYGSTALFKAAERGNADIVKLLLERGADATVKDTFYGANAISWAIDHSHVEVVRLILEKDPGSVDDVLMTGVRGGNKQLLEIALAKGGAKPETLTAALAVAMNDKDKGEFAELLKKAGALAPPDVDAATLQSYVGKYKNEQAAEVLVSLKDGKLLAIFPGQQPIVMSPIDKVSFRPTAFDGIVVTMQIEAAHVTGFTLKNAANTTLFKRVE